jgi:hypothetical protein
MTIPKPNPMRNPILRVSHMSQPTEHGFRLASLELAKSNPVIDQALDSRWDFYAPDESRWDKSYPYQLLVLSASKDGGYDIAPNGTFTLPIGPQSITISTPYAVDLSITLGGAVEEHGGAPIRMITLQGTTGILPGKPSGSALSTTSLGQSVFAGTVAAVKGLGNTAKSAADGPASIFQRAALSDTDFSNAALNGTTGYYQFLLLKYWLEAYVATKKTKEGRDFRLALAIWKEQEVYLVTPVSFDVSRSASSPLEYPFTLAFKAWKRIRLGTSPKADSTPTPITREPSRFAKLMRTLDTSRRTLQKTADVIKAIGGDINASLFEPLRSTVLFAKDALGVELTVADLPLNVIQDMKGPIIEAVSLRLTSRNVGDAYAGLGENLSKEVQDLATKIQEYAVASGIGESKVGTPSKSDPHPVLKALQQALTDGAASDLLRGVSVGTVNVPPAVNAKIVAERERVRTLRRLDFESYRNNLVTLLADFSDAVGAGATTYNTIYNRSSNVKTRTPSQDEWDVIFELNKVIQEYDRLAVADSQSSQDQYLNNIAGLASKSGIDFQLPASVFQVPYPYGVTLEQLATRYLGSPDRWHEIAAVNRLRAPYVDEEGFTLSLLVNGTGNQVVVNDASNLYTGQPVWISSSGQPREKRHVIGITTISNGYVALTLDGNPDLSRFTTAQSALVQAYLPNTVNSQQLIAIPSTKQPLSPDIDTKAIPGVDPYDVYLKVGGVDILLTPDGDLAMTNDGDCKYAVGMTNLVQRVRTFFGTARGSLIRHPSYGFPLEVGQSVADLTAKDILNGVKGIAAFDPVFTSVASASVVINGPVATIGTTLAVAGGQNLLPISVDLKR